MVRSQPSVRIIHGALDESSDGDIILRGVIEPDSLKLLQAADYQREVLPQTSLRDLMDAFRQGGRVPDVELGMRGQKVNDRDGVYEMRDPVFIIDGLQRITAAKEVMKEGVKPHIGTAVHFGTSEKWERERFATLNIRRAKLSPNVLARNLRHDYPVMKTLYRLTTTDRTFVMHNRVGWQQRQKRSELITATTLLKVAGYLHSHIGPGKSTGVNQLTPGLQKIYDRVGQRNFRRNVKAFFELIDDCWGVKSVAFKEGAAYLRTGFLICLASVFARHHHVFFREGKQLVIARDIRRKIAIFPISDPHIKELAASTGQGRNILYQHIINHINRGKRGKRLIEAENLPEDAPEINGG